MFFWVLLFWFSMGHKSFMFCFVISSWRGLLSFCFFMFSLSPGKKCFLQFMTPFSAKNTSFLFSDIRNLIFWLWTFRSYDFMSTVQSPSFSFSFLPSCRLQLFASFKRGWLSLEKWCSDASSRLGALCQTEHSAELVKQYSVQIDTFCCLSLFGFAYILKLAKIWSERRLNFSKSILNGDRHRQFLMLL